MIHDVITQYGYLVKTAVKQIDLNRIPPVIDYDDLLQCGYIELIRCGRVFKDDGRAKFSTYADKCIRNNIKKIISNAHWGPKHQTQHHRKKLGKEQIKDMVSYDSFTDVEQDGEVTPWLNTVSEKGSLWFEGETKPPGFNFTDGGLINLRKKIKSLLKRKADAGILYREKSNNTRGGYAVYVKAIKRVYLGLYDKKDEAIQARADYLMAILETIGSEPAEHSAKKPDESDHDDENNTNNPEEKEAMRQRMRVRYASVRYKKKA